MTGNLCGPCQMYWLRLDSLHSVVSQPAHTTLQRQWLMYVHAIISNSSFSFLDLHVNCTV